MMREDMFAILESAGIKRIYACCEGVPLKFCSLDKWQGDMGALFAAIEAWNRRAMLEAAPQPVAALEPVYWVYTINGSHTVGSAKKPPEDAYDEGTLHPLYDHAAPCARCAELETRLEGGTHAFERVSGRFDELQAKITEQAARIKALEAEVERQRNVIDDAKTALENGLEYVQQALTDFDNQYRHHPAVENERVLLVKDVEELTEALAAIAELEKGVG